MNEYIGHHTSLAGSSTGFPGFQAFVVILSIKCAQHGKLGVVFCLYLPLASISR